MNKQHPASNPVRPLAAIVGWLTIAIAMLAIDLAWLGVVAEQFYTQALGSLRSPTVVWPAALAFYAMYVSFVLAVAVIPARSLQNAVVRGSLMGLFAYATYELTNWAVITGWPGQLVMVDIVWGVILTGFIAGAGYLTFTVFQNDKVK